VTSAVRDAILKNTPGQLAGPLASAQATLDVMGTTGTRSALVEALKSLDTAADAHFINAVFDADGVALCGVVSLSHRQRPQVSFVRMAAGDGFDAIESWIPGGRIDRFSWTWRWFTSPVERPPSPSGVSTQEETFVLRRPYEPRSKFGLTLAREKPLPGLDGNGKLCLTVSGVYVDPFTGVLVPVTSTVQCQLYGYEFKLPYEVGPYLRICDPLRIVDGRAPEIGVLRVGVTETQTASDALVVYLRDRLDEEFVEVLTHGLGASRSDGVGLLVVLVFRDGALERDADTQHARIDRLRRQLPAPLLVAEDVRDGWSTALAIPSQGSHISWRLVTPDGAVRWSHDGPVEAEIVTRMLDTRLMASGPPTFAPIRTEIGLGREFPIVLATPECPPAPLGRGIAGSKVVFVSKDAASSRAALQRLRYHRYPNDDQDRPYVAVVVEGADDREIERLRKELQLDVPLFPDPFGALTRGAGVRLSPTTLLLDHRGIVVGVEMADGGRTHENRSDVARD
jgi:hypothetical protein